MTATRDGGRGAKKLTKEEIEALSDDEVAALVPLLPYKQDFVDDELAEYATLNPAERGALRSIRLLCWQRGGYVAADESRLARLAGSDPTHWSDIWSAIADRFAETNDGRLFHPGDLRQLADARRSRLARVEISRRGGEAKAAKDKAERAAVSSAVGSGNGMPSAVPTACPPSPSPSPSPKTSANGDRGGVGGKEARWADVATPWPDPDDDLPFHPPDPKTDPEPDWAQQVRLGPKARAR